MRSDSAAILRRFFFCEAALVRGQAGWLPAIASLDVKLTLPRHIWEDAQLAEALRNRVFELKFPSRFLEVGSDAPLTDLLEASRHAPGPAAYLNGLARVFVPALRDAYAAYLEAADDIGDGPTKRFLTFGIQEKKRQIEELSKMVMMILDGNARNSAEAEAWTDALKFRLTEIGGITLEPSKPVNFERKLPGSRSFTLTQIPARDARFRRMRFYWPDNVDPHYDYGTAILLQLRSAISHLNEVWAVETAGAILDAFADQLGWDFVNDAARWVYDESRHTMMGWTRLRDWGFHDNELPLGSYIYDSTRNEDPIYRLGMLSYFETKNIGKKIKRAEAFASYGDTASEHDMDFDWADEGMHTAYGQRWLPALFEQRGWPLTAMRDVRSRCDELVQAEVETATPQEIAETRAVADHLIARAHEFATVVA